MKHNVPESPDLMQAMMQGMMTGMMMKQKNPNMWSQGQQQQNQQQQPSSVAPMQQPQQRGY
jgi:hypothetical protein